MRIEVLYAPGPGQVDRVELDLPEGSTVQDALEASGLLARHPQLRGDALVVGVWGRVQPLAARLRERDRVEIYRPLTVDPKEARRLRYRQHKQRRLAPGR